MYQLIDVSFQRAFHCVLPSVVAACVILLVVHRTQLRECLRKQRELQKWKNQQLEARIANETQLARAEEHFAARQQEHVRALANQAAEYDRLREQSKADREQDRRDHAEEVANLTKLHVSTVR